MGHDESRSGEAFSLGNYSLHLIRCNACFQGTVSQWESTPALSSRLQVTPLRGVRVSLLIRTR